MSESLWPTDCSPPGSSVRGISQVKILEWVVIPFSRGSSWSRDWSHVSCIGRQVLYHWSTREAQSTQENILITRRNHQSPILKISMKIEASKLIFRPKRRILNLQSKGIWKILDKRIKQVRLAQKVFGEMRFIFVWWEESFWEVKVYHQQGWLYI